MIIRIHSPRIRRRRRSGGIASNGGRSGFANAAIADGGCFFVTAVRLLLLLLLVLLRGSAGPFSSSSSSTTTTIIATVEALWYSEICHTGPRYKVRLDPSTGTIVPVYDRSPTLEADKDAMEHGGMRSDGVFFDVGNPFSDNNNKNSKNYPNRDNDDGDDGGDGAMTAAANNNNETDDDPIGDETETSWPTQPENWYDNDDTDDGNSNINGDPTTDPLDNTNNEQQQQQPLDDDDGGGTSLGGTARRWLRSARFWKDWDVDSESDPLVVAAMVKGSAARRVGGDHVFGEEADPSVAAEFVSRFLRASDETFGYSGGGGDGDDLLREGEFYVKPCLCSGSRWTFREDAGRLPPTVYNDTTDTLTLGGGDEQHTGGSSSSRGNDYGHFLGGSYANTDAIHPRFANPNNYGKHSSGTYQYVPNNVETGELYLCNVQSMYCGVPVVESSSDPGDDPLSWMERSGGSDQQRRRRRFLVDVANNNNNNNRGGGVGRPSVKCYSQNMRHIIARNAWPLILLWYFGLAIICCCTVHGRTAGDYVLGKVAVLGKAVFCCCCRNHERIVGYDFNDAMLRRMVDDDERERRRTRNRGGQNWNDEDDNDNGGRPWYFSRQRLQFERSLLAQVQWIWRHQEYLREASMRERGLPPPQIRLRVKTFSHASSTFGGFGTSDGEGETKTETETERDDRKLPPANNNDNNAGATPPPAPKHRRSLSNGLSSVATSLSSPFAQTVARRRFSDDESTGTDRAVGDATMPTQDTVATANSTEASNATTTAADAADAAADANTENSVESDDDDDDGGNDENENHNKNTDEDLEFITIEIGRDAADGDDDVFGDERPPATQPQRPRSSSGADADDDDVAAGAAAIETTTTTTKPIVGIDATEPTALTCIPCDTNDDDDDDDDLDSLDVPTCTICFVPFEEGDRIADLPCKHEFHVDCLKVWVQRKNSCPLCNVRLGRPERPDPMATTTASPPGSGSGNGNANESGSTGTGSSSSSTGGDATSTVATHTVEGGLLRRIGRGFRRSSGDGNENTSSNHSSSFDTAPTRTTIGAGEVRVGMRIGIIGAASAAEDINAARESRRGMTRSR